MKATPVHTPPRLVFPPQVPFSWTLRWARARRLKPPQDSARPISYRIVGAAQDEQELAAVTAFCDRHAATLELDRGARALRGEPLEPQRPSGTR